MPNRIRVRDVFSFRFWVNYVFILAVSCWLPMSSLRSVMRDPSGAVIQEHVQQIRVYVSYGRLFRHFSSADLIAVLLHLGISFVVCFLVWYVVMRMAAQPAQSPEENAPEDDGSGTA